MRDFATLQLSLAEALRANQPDSEVEHVMVMLPSHSVAESLLAHYGPRMRALEHRYLVAYFLLRRVPHCEIVYLASQEPDPEVIEYYTALMSNTTAEAARLRSRLHTMVVDEGSTRSVSAKLLDRPDLLDRLRALIAGRIAFIQPWNVTDLEVQVALRLQVPLHGTPPELWPTGFKSAGRRLFRSAGVPVPVGREDVRSVDDVMTGIATVLAERPGASGVVVKHDDSGAGDGNVVIGLRGTAGGRDRLAEIRNRVESLPEWYLTDLAKGGVVEELITGEDFCSPSAQLHLSPSGQVTVLATHEQILGGPSGQVFMGCKFPADPAYSARIAHYAEAVGRKLAERKAVGRLAIDFAVVRAGSGGGADGAGDRAGDRAGDGAGGSAEGGRDWRIHALEINLRNGGTTHPYAVLRNLVPGFYDVDSGQWLAEDGMPRAYHATDNMVEISWLGLPPGAVIEAIAAAGLQFDLPSGTGVVLHMLSSLAIDGRLGLTAIAHSPNGAEQMVQATRAVLRAAAPGLRRVFV